MNARQSRIVARRMRHRSRSVAVVTALSALIIVAVWLGIEAALAAFGLPKLLVSPALLVRAITDVGLIAALAAAALVVFGVVLILLAVAPARLARRVVADERSLIVVDDAVIASSVSRAAASAARVSPDRVRTALSRRSASVSVQPQTGFPVAREAVQSSVEQVLAPVSLRPIRTRIAISTHGKVAS